MTYHVPLTPHGPLESIFGALPALSRAELETLATVAIETLDALDGDADLEAEPDLEDSHDRELDLSDMEPDCGADMPAPVYGIDQSAPLQRYGLPPILDPVAGFDCGGIGQ